jgi:DNA-binding transcriptional ArsR family regulator
VPERADPGSTPLSQPQGLDVLDALASPARLTIFQWLLRQEPRFVPMSEITAQLGFRRSSLSPHLAALLRAGLVCALGQGEDKRYRACASSIDRLSNFLAADCCAGRVERCVSDVEPVARACDRESDAVLPVAASSTRIVAGAHDPDTAVAAVTPHPLLISLSNDAERWGATLAERAAHAGLAVTQPDGALRSIPIGALPLILDDDEIARRARLASHLVGAVAKAARWRMGGVRRGAVIAALGPTEQRLVDATWRGPADLAVARVDFLGSPQLQALEINATIPAMQGYSDIAAEAWLATVAAGRADLQALITANGSNAAALLQALVDLHARQRSDELATIGLVCRRGDAQLTELRSLRDRFRAAGLQAHVVHPDQLAWQGAYLVFEGEPLQLIYRHVFLSRLDDTPAADLEAAILSRERRGTLVLNRPAPHLEMKSTLALLSRAGDSAELAHALELDAVERDAIRASVPWTRVLSSNDDEGIDEARRDEIRAHPEAYVLKRSWSYGGNEVFVGRAHDTGAFWSRVHATYPEVDRWADLVDRAARDPRGGGFIVQRAVPRVVDEQFLCTPTAVQRTSVVTDYAAYASLGASPAWQGVSRAASSDIVNIVGGGAIVPVLRRSVADALLSGYALPSR